MSLKDLIGQVQQVAGEAADLGTKYLDEFNEALPTIHALGFSVRDFSVGMGLIPEVAGTLVGCIDDIDAGRLKELIALNTEKKTLVTLLKALQAAYNIKKQVPDIPFKGIQVDLKLGLPPHVAVKFLSTVPEAAVGVAAV
jgi:hypothetical protein